MSGYVYILQENRGGRYYIGSTSNLEKRFKQHTSGHTHSTKRMSELSLVFSQEYENIELAQKVELKLKKLRRRDHIEKIIKDGFIKIAP